MKKLSETKFFSGLERHSNVPDKVVAILLAFIPIFQHYRGPLAAIASAVFGSLAPVQSLSRLNLSFSLLLFLTPYLFLRMLPRLRRESWKGVLLLAPVMAFFAFKIVDHGTSLVELAQVGLPLFFLLAAALGVIDVKTLAKAASCIAAAAGIAMIAQYICFYIFDFHLQLVPTRFLMPSAQQWIGCVETGLISVNGRPMDFYRPAAFFMEPSHVFMYCFPALFINLYREEKSIWNWIASFLVSAGIVLSTSGMGVAVVFGAWVLFSILWDAKVRRFTILRWQNWVRTICIAVALLLIFLTVPSINSSIARVVGLKSIPLPWMDAAPSQDVPGSLEDILSGSNAVSGRVTGALGMIKEMTPLQRIIGCTDTIKGIETNLPGFMATLYKYGIIGTVLSYLFYLYGLRKLNCDYFVFTLILLLVSFFSAHTHSVLFMLYYVLLLCQGHKEVNGLWQKELVRTFRFLTFRKPE